MTERECLLNDIYFFTQSAKLMETFSSIPQTGASTFGAHMDLNHGRTSMATTSSMELNGTVLMGLLSVVPSIIMRPMDTIATMEHSM